MATKAEQHATNGYDPEQIEFFANKVFDVWAELDGERAEHLNACKQIRQKFAPIYEEAEARGLPKEALRIFVETERATKKVRARINKLESETRETVEQVAEAFGKAVSLPLFAQHIDRMRAAEGNGEAGTTRAGR